ncbi:MAG: hypothetical protein AAF553_00595 [Pseudomonadota bacterium]
MIDIPPEAELPQGQIIEQRLVKCGLDAKGLTVRYEAELKSIEVIIGLDAGATVDHFACIHEASAPELVFFEDREMHGAFSGWLSELMRPQRLAQAEAELDRRGLLDGFPERSAYSSDKKFAEALEAHCGLEIGSFFEESEWGLIGSPKTDLFLDEAEWDKFICILTAMSFASAKGEAFKVGFVGNELVREEP